MKFKTLNALFFIFLSVLAKAQTLDWNYTNVTFKAGDTVSVVFKTTGFNAIVGFQYAMKADTSVLEFCKVGVANSPIVLTGEFSGYKQGNFSWFGKPGYNLKPGEMRTLWTTPYGKTLPENTHTHTVMFKAKKDGNLCSSFSLWANHPILKSSAAKFPSSPVVQRVLCFEQSQQVVSRENEQVKVYPNPVTDVLYFNDVFAVKLFDINGKLIVETTDNYLDVSYLQQGFYFALIDNNVIKIIKQ